MDFCLVPGFTQSLIPSSTSVSECSDEEPLYDFDFVPLITNVEQLKPLPDLCASATSFVQRGKKRSREDVDSRGQEGLPGTGSPSFLEIDEFSPVYRIRPALHCDPLFSRQDGRHYRPMHHVAGQFSQNWINPFAGFLPQRHLICQQRKKICCVAINGYIKIRLHGSSVRSCGNTRRIIHDYRQRKSSDLVDQRSMSSYGCKEIRLMNWLLARFYLTAFSRGRTVFEKTNPWGQEFAQLATELVIYHAIRAIAATYVLDFSSKDIWRQLANDHYQKAIIHLDEKLKLGISDQRNLDIILTALVLLICEDVITWEAQQQAQRWYAGTLLAIHILDQLHESESGTHALYMQQSVLRRSNVNLIASYAILAQPVIRLTSTSSYRNFDWLLHGELDEQMEINGSTGVCPKLLHILSQITSLCRAFTEENGCDVIPFGAQYIRKQLSNFCQWSELSSIRYNSEAELFESCRVDHFGRVRTAAEVTDLTAYSWVCAARIYLQCRFFRRPRSHPSVKKPLESMIRCIQMLPNNGTLFTSQSPFFPIFVMSVVAMTSEERQVATEWFEVVVQEVGRSSVPPVWSVIKENIWPWIDNNLREDPVFGDERLKERQPWWEMMVDKLETTIGILSLS